ncbi:von Hippel-Lindau disease tumor suppressor [Ambystoma mexicanum]|uniref:von Hippel-Lindau disease tumor suppressor n=1 Tax=Ambystoma mexicanum TaxID=8296 RepID=UPI0037E7EDDC
MMPEPQLQSEAELPLRSVNTRRLLRVTFCNRSPRPAIPVWIDFNGERTDYRVIPPGRGLHMDTYLRHLWLFRDAHTEDGLLANKKEWFLLFKCDEQQPIRVDITLPVYSLKERSLQVVRSLVRPEDYRKLEIARSLWVDLEDRPSIAKDLRRLARENGDEIREETPT